MGANDQQQRSNVPAKNGEKKRLLHRSMGTAAGLRKLLPAGTTLAFETMAPSFTKGGQCSDHDVNFIFTWALIGFLTFLCAALRFTDSITDRDGNTHYGVATPRGFKLFNCRPKEDLQLSDDEWKNLKTRMKWKLRDFLHAVLGAAVFGVLAFGDAGVQRCLVPWESRHWRDLLAHLPLAVGFFASFVFMIWPSTRNGIGEAGGVLGDTEEEKETSSQKEHTSMTTTTTTTTTTTAGKKNLFFDKTMGTMANLSKLLPTGTTLAFETMAPPFTRGGQCKDHDVNFFFTWWLIVFLTLLCAELRFTDSLTDRYGNTYYGVATRDGLLLFNHDPRDLRLSDDERENRRMWKRLKRAKKVKPRDFLHAVFSAAVFMALAFCNAGVQRCLVPWESRQWKELLSILPLAVGFLASFVFIIFPSDRIGIGEEASGASDGGDAAPAPAPAPRGQSLQNIKTTVQQATTQVQVHHPSTSYELGIVG